MLRKTTLILVAAWLLVLPATADAYIGPGAGITAIGSVIAFLGAVFFAIVGFIWYPIKRLLRAVRGKDGARERAAGKATPL